MRKTKMALALALAGLCALGRAGAAEGPKEASEATRAANAATLGSLPFADQRDFEEAQRGFIGTVPGLNVRWPDGGQIYNLSEYEAFLDGTAASKAPDTVNPSAWRQSNLAVKNGLFKVQEIAGGQGIYQVRGFDISNMTIVEGKSGIIVIDPLISAETAKAAMELYQRHRGKREIVAVIYTHSHTDHFGGVKGILGEERLRSGKTKVIAPEGFLEEAVSENVYAGTAMSRRSLYQYGPFLPKGAKGSIGTGLGVGVSNGTVTLVAPTDIVKKTGERRVVDGVEMEFQMAPGTEAPSEMLIWLPQFKALNTAEDVTHTMHNLYTLRGAQVRDARTWWKVINEAMERYGQKAEVVFAQHHWPVWGRERALELMGDQRDMLKYIHDQVLNMANKGLRMDDIAERIELPDSIGKKWHNRGYYGSLSHNAKAVYQRYLGWYDSNPAHLHRLPPVEAAKRYVQFMGGEANVVRQARDSYAKGDYRWVAEVLSHVVFANPSNMEARNLEADALEQMGYQAEDPTWRNEFLMGALDLRNGTVKVPSSATTASPDLVASMTPSMLADYMGIRLNGPKAAGKSARVNWEQPGGKAVVGFELRNGVLVYTEGKALAKPDATIVADQAQFAALAFGEGSPSAAAKAGKAKVAGDAGKADELFGLMDKFDVNFPLALP